jgi:hypothetical protein
MAAKAKSKNHAVLLVVLVAAAAGGGWWYYENKKKQAAAAGASSSSQAQGVAPLPMNLPSPMEYPNQMTGTPTIQNYVTNPAPVTSTQTTIIAPVLTGFHHKPHPWIPHPPHSPHRR